MDGYQKATSLGTGSLDNDPRHLHDAICWMKRVCDFERFPRCRDRVRRSSGDAGASLSWVSWLRGPPIPIQVYGYGNAERREWTC